MPQSKSPYDAFIPREFRQDSNLARRARLVALVALGAFPVCVGFAAQQRYVFASEAASDVLLVTAGALLATLAVLHVTRSPTAAGHTQMAILCAALGAISYLRGGMVPNVLMWALVIPPSVILFTASGFVVGVVWAGVILAEILVLNELMKRGYPGTPLRLGTGVFGLSALLLVTTGIALAYELGRRQQEEDRQKLERQLLEGKKLESIGRLAAGIAHDFNNLLTVIRTQSKLLDGELTDRPNLRRDLAAIDEAAEKGALLTRQLLAFGRKGIVNPEAFPLSNVVSAVQNLLARVLPESIEILVTAAAAPWQVVADREQVEQVVMNLVLNARDAMPNGGRLTIDTSNAVVSEDRTPDAPDLVPGKYVVLAVVDEGVGIADDVLAHLFEPFFTTKAPSGGTGLGLASAYGIVRQAGGAIVVESELGRGSTFRVYFPATDAEPSAAEAPPRVAPLGKTPATILLVEDEPAVRRATARLLIGQGYKVITAEDGARGVEVGSTHPGPIDLLLTDVVMPKLSGHQVAEALRDVRPDLRVTYVSGYADDPDIARQVAEHRASFIRKPYATDDLLRVIEGILAKR